MHGKRANSLYIIIFIDTNAHTINDINGKERWPVLIVEVCRLVGLASGSEN